MKILVVGGGGREHALAWKLACSPQAKKVWVAPGNAGTALEPTLENVNLSATDIEGLLAFAKENAVDLTVIGPEAPLVAGIVDTFEQAGLACLGPSQYCAQLEGSKRFCKDFFARYNIPTAAYQTFTQTQPAKAYVQSRSFPIVIKADGLAAGKGVVIAENEAQAFATIDDMLEGNRFGNAGHQIVIEDFLQGEEASFIVLADGESVVAFPTSQDHKARDEGDKGPNTGGMGAYTPAPVMTESLIERALETVIRPTLAGLKSEGHIYRGFLYAGLMISPAGDINVLEFNCRFGDPETQPIMMRLTSDFAALCLAATNGSMQEVPVTFDPRPAIGVVMAAGGYPDAYEKYLPIILGEDDSDTTVKVFHAGTQLNDAGQVVTNGGRVLCVTALGEDLQQAQARAYARAKHINWQGSFYRSDIGHRALNR
ncbi:MAG: phosphoribosylamine--glycine ligase [Legionellales bacterium]|nr:phosphoribosylamine--glycine ligase [Legionellales bacterium]